MRALPLAAVLTTAAFWTGLGRCDEAVLRYDFAGERPFIVDLCGHMNHGLAHDAVRVTEGGKSCLKLGPQGCVRLPEASVLLGPKPPRGAVELSVKPDFDPRALPTGVWDGWVVLVYLQKTSGNGLPDGYNEIGLALHGPTLIAKVAGSDPSPFAVIDTPLARGKWTRLRMEWAPGRRALLVDGKLVAERLGPYDAPSLDTFPAYLGRHPSSGRWNFVGSVADLVLERGP